MDRSRHRLTPLDVQSVRFRRVRWGYDLRQVDQYLDQVAGELIRLHQQLQQHPAQEPNTHPLPPDTPVAGSPTVARVRVLAIRCASGIIAEALVEAARIYECADRQARELLADAHREVRAPASPCRPDQTTGAAVQVPRMGPPDQGAAVSEPDNAGSDPAEATGMVLHGPWEVSGRRR